MLLALKFISNLLFFLVIFGLVVGSVRENKDGEVLIENKLRKYAWTELIVIVSILFVVRICIILIRGF